MIFCVFDKLESGISHELNEKDYERLKKMGNEALFYCQSEQYKKQTIGTWITEVFLKHISMKYF